MLLLENTARRRKRSQKRSGERSGETGDHTESARGARERARRASEGGKALSEKVMAF